MLEYTTQKRKVIVIFLNDFFFFQVFNRNYITWMKITTLLEKKGSV